MRYYPFQIVYGFSPLVLLDLYGFSSLVLLDLTPLPCDAGADPDGRAKVDTVYELQAKTKEIIEKKKGGDCAS